MILLGCCENSYRPMRFPGLNCIHDTIRNTYHFRMCFSSDKPKKTPKIFF